MGRIQISSSTLNNEIDAIRSIIILVGVDKYFWIYRTSVFRALKISRMEKKNNST